MRPKRVPGGVSFRGGRRKAKGPTTAQVAWLAGNAPFELVGSPTRDSLFHRFGTLYSDGVFDPIESGVPIRRDPGLLVVAVPR